MRQLASDLQTDTPPFASYKNTFDQDDGQRWLRSSMAEIARHLHIPVSPLLQRDHDVFQHLHFKMGQKIFSMGTPFKTIYLINSGFTKSVILDEYGNEQVVGFQMKEGILGIDGIHTGHHNSEAIALTDCDVILLPLKKLTSISQTYHQFDHAILTIISTELIHQQNRLCMLAAKNSEVRVANFLLSLSDRYFQLGYSRSVFILRMSRNDIGSYLGLTLETVSRTLSLLNNAGLIAVKYRGITLLDAQGLRNLVEYRKCTLRNGLTQLN